MAQFKLTKTRMLLGIGKAVITPPLGTRLAGFAHRKHGTDEVLDELELRVFWFEQAPLQDAPTNADEQASTLTACIISADIIGWSDALTEEARRRLAQRFGIAPEAILLSASHTHSGPQTCGKMNRAGGLPDPNYIAALLRHVEEAVACAQKNMRPVVLRAARGQLSGYAINRRLLVNGKAEMLPNPNGVCDDEVTVISCRDAKDNSVHGVLFRYTCHPTVMGDYRITGDYPGAARRYIEKEWKGASAAFLPGCFGDVRPDCELIGGHGFRRGLPEEVEIFGAALGREVVRIVEEHADGPPLQPRIFARATKITLPLQMKNETAQLSLQRLDLAQELSLVSLGGEICVEYAHYIKGLRPNKFILPLGYSNGMIGYISPASQFTEGGYEPDTSHSFFDLTSPFQPTIESVIQEAVCEIME